MGDTLRRLVRYLAALVAGMMALVGLVVVMTWAAMALAGLGPTDDPTTGYLVMNLAGSLLAAVLAGMLAAAVGRSVVPAVGLAIVVLGMSVGSGASAAPGQPEWYPVVVGVIGTLGTLAGAAIIRIRARGRKKPTGSSATPSTRG